MSTVGYGDEHCETLLGRTFLVFFLLVGLVSFKFLINYIMYYTINILHKAKRKNYMVIKLDVVCFRLTVSHQNLFNFKNEKKKEKKIESYSLYFYVLSNLMLFYDVYFQRLTLVVNKTNLLLEFR